MMICSRAFLLVACFAFSLAVFGTVDAQDWPTFRGPSGGGIVDGFPVRSDWNADVANGEMDGILWKIKVPGLGHSSPVVLGDRIFLATAIAADGKAPLKVGRGGRPEAADDNGEQSWVVLCYDRRTGKELWQKTAHKGVPVQRDMPKPRMPTPASSSQEITFWLSLVLKDCTCYDLDGTLKWSRDLGVINISKYGIGWGYASSPAIHNDRIAVVCDDPANPYMAVLNLSDGEEIWRESRKGICERSWSTPFIHSQGDRTQIVRQWLALDCFLRS